MYSEINKCRLCGCNELEPIINLGKQKLTGIFPLLENEEDVESVPLELVRCKNEKM